MIRVRCQQHVTVDDKGRLALPAPIRRALDESQTRSLVLAFSRGGVWGWTPTHYETEVEGRMMQPCPRSRAQEQIGPGARFQHVAEILRPHLAARPGVHRLLA